MEKALEEDRHLLMRNIAKVLNMSFTPAQNHLTTPLE
jgi:hypothetical protein